MTKTLENLAWQKRKLFEKHPDLEKGRVVQLSRTNLDMPEIARFMRYCWSKDYPDGFDHHH